MKGHPIPIPSPNPTRQGFLPRTHFAKGEEFPLIWVGSPRVLDRSNFVPFLLKTNIYLNTEVHIYINLSHTNCTHKFTHMCMHTFIFDRIMLVKQGQVIRFRVGIACHSWLVLFIFFKLFNRYLTIVPLFKDPISNPICVVYFY